MKLIRLGFLLFAVSIYLLASPVSAEIYKYKDKNGRWQFTDKPVDKNGKPIMSKNYEPPATSKTKTRTRTKNKSDLKKSLIKTFNPDGKIDEATLSVVTVITKVSSGSGFFITDDGYLITNRHVIRPATTRRWKETAENLSEREETLKTRKESLKLDERTIKEQKLVIAENREYMKSGKASKSEQRRYKRYVENYNRNKDNYKTNKKNFRKLEQDYKKARSEHSFNSSVSSFSKKFTIILKNDVKHAVRLIKVSKSHDLALLKLDNYSTPYLNLAKAKRPKQGVKVFAIGSPLGVTDSLTTGIVTKAGKDYIYTDAQILPGSSGGPLVNQEGIVIGVNTAKLSQGENADGIGLAVYSGLIRSEFRSNLPSGF